jgi:rare lipoprotein A
MRLRSIRGAVNVKGLWVILTILMLTASCAGQGVPTDPGFPASLLGSAAPSGTIYRETGLASWSGKESRGRITASGEPFDMYGMFAAHRTLPLGTIIRVTNLDNYKSVTVKINDRGPFITSRIIELSYGAAKKLGFVAQGTATVKVETLEPVNVEASYTVQAAVFTEQENAEALQYRLSKKYQRVFIVPYETSLGTLYRVRVGSYESEEKAELVASRLKQEGLEPMVVMRN